MNIRPDRLVRCTVLAAALAGNGAASAQALYYYEANAGANAIAFGTTVQPSTQTLSAFSQAAYGPIVASREASLIDNSLGASLTGRGTSTVSASPGVIRVQTVTAATVSSASVSNPFANASGQANAIGFFRDVLIVDIANAAAGDRFTATSRVWIDADSMLNATIDSGDPVTFVAPSSSWKSRVSMTSSATGWMFQDEHAASCSWAGSMQCTGDAPGWATVTYDVVNGSRVVFEMSAEAKSFAGALLAGPGSVSTEAIVDMGHTLAWGGVTALWDASGNPVTNFSMMGLGTGFDFRYATAAAVPEPTTVALALAGLGLMMCRRWLQPRQARRDTV